MSTADGATQEAVPTPATARPSRFARTLQSLRPKTWLEALGLVVLIVLIVLIVAAPLVTPFDPIEQDFDTRKAPPSLEHPLGTDQLGRDQLSRVLYGGRTSILLGVLVIVLAGLFGTVVGAISGFFGGGTDEVLMRTGDIFLAFPSIMLAMIVVASLGPSLQNAAIAIAVAWWVIYARLVRGQVIMVRDREFVLASKTLGAGQMRVLFRTVLPNSLTVLRMILILDLGFAIIAGSTLSFLGLGVSPPEPEWGLMIREAIQHQDAWWMMMGPAGVMILFVASLNAAGRIFTKSDVERRAEAGHQG